MARLSDKVYRSVVLALEQPVSESGDESLNLIDVLCDTDAVGPDEVLESREMLAYLHDAIGLLPERHRLVVVGYFLEGRSSLEIGRFLGVTESRISQLRSEALEMLKFGIEAQYEPVARPSTTNRRVGVRLSESRAEYVAAIARARAGRPASMGGPRSSIRRWNASLATAIRRSVTGLGPLRGSVPEVERHRTTGDHDDDHDEDDEADAALLAALGRDRGLLEWCPGRGAALRS